MATNKSEQTALGFDSGSGALTNVDENGNPVEEDLGGVAADSQFGVFARCVIRSVALLRVDIRQTGLPPELAEKITTAVKHRELRSKGIPVDAYEAAKEVPEEPPQEEA